MILNKKENIQVKKETKEGKESKKELGDRQAVSLILTDKHFLSRMFLQLQVASYLFTSGEKVGSCLF